MADCLSIINYLHLFKKNARIDDSVIANCDCGIVALNILDDETQIEYLEYLRYCPGRAG